MTRPTPWDLVNGGVRVYVFQHFSYKRHRQHQQREGA